MTGFVGKVWFFGTVVNGKFFKVGNDADGKFCTPTITANLVSWCYFGFD